MKVKTWRVGRRACCAAVAFVSLISTASAESIIRNSGFEIVPAGNFQDQAYLPSDWFQVGLPLPWAGADTYSNDGSYGLSPSANGNFNGVSAFEGIRFVAGGSGESFGQSLSSTLTPGQNYQLSAVLHRAFRYDIKGAGGYEVYLASSVDGSNPVLIATLGPTVGSEATSPEWESKFASFIAPANAAELPVIIFAPFGSDAYPAIDNVSLTVPEPSSLTALVGIGLMLFALTVRRRRQAI